MTRTIIFAAALAALLSPLAPAHAQQAPSGPRMADVMSPAELRATGIASLTAAQRAALDAWVARYTAIIERAAARGAQVAADTSASSSSSPSSSGNAQSNETYSGPLAVPYGARIAQVKDGGTFILLSDGTEWEAYLPDRPKTTTWAISDYLIVAGRAVELNGEFYFQLINGRDGTSAAVKWRGKRQ